MTTELFNPLLPGFNPDPSVVRVGDDYYLVTSSFEYMPGLPVYHSTDFETWSLVGHVATRPDQLLIGDVASGAGVYAPTLRYHEGLFYLIVGIPGGRGTIVFTAASAAGPWSDGVKLNLEDQGVYGIDPDLAWGDDGAAYVTFARISIEGETAGRNIGIHQVRVDLETGAVLSEPSWLWSGVGLQFPEAPHLYQRGDYWYLLIAEGGTERGHAVSIARGTSPEGPFEGGPANPILSARSTDLPIQNIGHGDLVELPDGSTGMVLLGVRPTFGAYSSLGRETYATRIEWVAGWPVAEPPQLNPRSSDIEYTISFDAVDGFDTGWLSMREVPEQLGAIVDGALVLTGNGDGLDDLHPRFIGRRQLNPAVMVSTIVDAEHATAGLAIRFDEAHHYEIEASGTAAGNRVVARGRLSGIQQEWDAELPAGPVLLRVEVVPPPGGMAGHGQHERIVLSAAPEAEPEQVVTLAELDGRYLSVEVAKSFTGRVIGLYSRTGTARFANYCYRGAEVSG